MLEGTQIGRFRIQAELGHGGMGTVYRAEDPVIGRSVAIKVIRLDDAGPPEVQRQIAQSFLREIHTAGVLQHPGIASIYDAGKQDNMAYIVMELVGGTTLESMLCAEPPSPLPTLLGVCRQAAAALDYAHANGVIHRDVKPSNILVQPDGMAKIVDFGIAKVAQATTVMLSQTGTTLGTPDYMSPEQVLGKPLDGRTDQWSLAVVTYMALTGSKPFPGEHFTQVMEAIMQRDAEPPSSLKPALTKCVDGVIARALAKDPAQRFRTCTEFVTALEKACGLRRLLEAPLETAPAVDQEPQAVPAPRKTARWAVAAAVLVALTGAGLAAWRYYRPARPAPAAAVAPLPVAPAPKIHTSRTRTKTVEALPDQRRVERAIESHVVHLVTTPPNADVTVDSKAESACHSPCIIELTAGTHSVHASKDGYYPLSKSFEVEVDQQEIPFALEQAMGSLLIQTAPEGATISADGNVLGSVTPTAIRLPMGRHRITLTKDGFTSYTFEAVVDDSLSHSTSVTLVPAH